MVSFILPGNSASGGYEVANSLRFDDGSSDYLVRTPSSSGNRQTFTISFWYKRTTPGTSGSFIRADNGSGIDGGIRISTDSIQFFDYNSSYKTNLVTTQLLRDVSAWYHIVCVADTTNSTSGDRALIYLNGTRITDFSSETYPTQDLNFSSINDSSFAQNIGRSQNFATYLDGYLAEFCFIDGQALTPTSFGEFDSDTNIWKPINVSGLTFGTNGFYLDFENSSSLGADVSGNGNNFTVNNLTSIDQSTDTCTNNFATLNPIDKPTNSSGSSGTLPTLSNGNLSVVNTNSAFREARSTYYLTTGKWYWETKMTRLSNTLQVGVVLNNYSAGSGERRMYQNNGNKYISSSSSYGATFTTNDIIGIALNLDDGEITFYKNGTTQGVAATDLVSGIDDTGWTPAVNCYDADCDFNFGSPPYSISSGNSDGNGYGNFEYSVPSGYYSLCTKNLAEYG
jgi:hypothetical protein